jgi:hypothetical protein
VQHLVAEVVAPAVVDPFEVVEVDVEQAGRMRGVVPELDGVAEPLVEEGAVRETGQRVVEGELAQLLLGFALARDVEEVTLQVERALLLVDDDHALVSEPDDAAVAGDQPVFETERLVRLVRVLVGRQHALAILRVQQAREQVRVGGPFLDAVAEDRLDLTAREYVRADLVECVDVDDERELLDERAVAAADLLRRQTRVVVEFAKGNRHRRH